MDEPASWQLVEFLADRVREITIDNGFYTDIGLGKIVLDDEDVQEDDVPSVVIEATLATVGSQGAGHLNSDVDITIEYGIPRLANVPNAKRQVHRARLDLVRALTFNNKSLPRFVRSFEQVDASLGSGNNDAGAYFTIAQVTARAGLTDLKSPAS